MTAAVNNGPSVCSTGPVEITLDDTCNFLERCGALPIYDIECKDYFAKELSQFMGGHELDNDEDGSGMFANPAGMFQNMMGVNARYSADGRKIEWGESTGTKSYVNLTADVAAGGTTVSIDDAGDFVVGSELLITGCSDNDCGYIDFRATVTAVTDTADGADLTISAGPDATIFASEDSSADGCSTCDARVFYAGTPLDCCDEIPEHGNRNSGLDTKFSYIQNFGEILNFEPCDFDKCYTCSYDEFNQNEFSGYEAVHKQKFRDMRRRFYQAVLLSMYMGTNDLNSDGKPLTTGLIPYIRSCGCNESSFCNLSSVEKAKALLNTIEEAYECRLDNDPDMFLVINNKARQSWTSQAGAFNRIFNQADTCCGLNSQDKIYDFSYGIKTPSSDTLRPVHSQVLTELFPNRSVMILMPKEWM